MPPSPDNRPNVLVLHCDQLRRDCLGYAGNAHVLTPNIDRLAGESFNVRRHIVSNSVCMPSRASLMTGLYPPGHGVWANGVALQRRRHHAPQRKRPFVRWPDMPSHMQVEPPTMADVFARAGYRTAAFGKMHLTPYLCDASLGYEESFDLWASGRLDDWWGPYYGFEHMELIESHAEETIHLGHYANWLRAHYPDAHREAKANVDRQPRPVPAVGDLFDSVIPLEAHHTTWLARRFEARLDAVGPDSPFLCFVGFPGPHHPFSPTPEALARFADADVQMPLDREGAGSVGPWNDAGRDISDLGERELRTVIRYTYAMIHEIDLAVGRMIDALERRGLWDNTIVVFTSDHGDFLGDHGRLYKDSVGSRSLLHVPCLLRVPGRDGKAIDRVTSNCDILPTLAAAAGVEGPEWVHGRDLTVEPDDEPAAFAFNAGLTPERINHTIVTDRHLLTLWPHAGHTVLYDHDADPAEVCDLADDGGAAELRDRLLARLRQGLEAAYRPLTARVSVG